MRARSSATRLSGQAFELSLAAPLVIAQRMSRMMAAGPALSARDRREFSLMGTEKVLAFQQACAAMWTQALFSQFALARSMAATAMPTMMSREALKVMSAGLAPVHRKAVANAKRLSRRK
jgi:hypothetical protein